MIVVELNKIKLYAKHSFIGTNNEEDYRGYTNSIQLMQFAGINRIISG